MKKRNGTILALGLASLALSAAATATSLAKGAMMTKAEDVAFSQTFAYGSGLEQPTNSTDQSSYWLLKASSTSEVSLSLKEIHTPSTPVKLTFNVATYGNGNKPALNSTLSVEASGAESASVWTGTKLTGTAPSSGTFVNMSLEMDVPAAPVPLSAIDISMTIGNVRQIRFKSVTVSYSYTPAAATDPAIEVANPTNHLKFVGDTADLGVSVVNGTGSDVITYTSSNPDVATISDSGIITAVSVGSTTISLSADGCEPVGFTLTVVSAHQGTIDDPLTAQEAVSMYNVAGDTTTVYYVAGYVSSVEGTNIYIDDKAFEFFKTVAGDGIDLASIQVGDYVRGFGKLTAYNSQVEFNAGTIDFVKTPALISMSFSGSLTKTSYYETADAWDISGLSLSGTFEGNRVENIALSSAEISYSVAAPSAVVIQDGETSAVVDLTITAKYQEVTATHVQSITVNADALTSLAITGQQTEFTLGSQFSLGSGTLKANHSSNTKTDLTLDDVEVQLGGVVIDPAVYEIKAEDDGKEVTLSYTEKNVTKSVSYAISVSTDIIVGNTIANISSENGWTNATPYSGFDLDENVKVSATNKSGTAATYYSSDSTWRLYQNGSTGNTVLTVSLPEMGYTLVSVNVTYKINKTGTLMLTDKTTKVASGTDYACSGNSISFVVGNTGTVTNGQAQITAISVTYKMDAVGTWCNDFLNGLVCDSTGTLAPDADKWLEYGESYLALDPAVQTKISTLASNPSGNIVEQAFAKYDYIINKYNTVSTEVYLDFAERVASGLITLRSAQTGFKAVDDGVTNWSLVAISAIAGIATAGSLLLLRRKKQDRE